MTIAEKINNIKFEDLPAHVQKWMTDRYYVVCNDCIWWDGSRANCEWWLEQVIADPDSLYDPLRNDNVEIVPVTVLDAVLNFGLV